MKLHCKMSKVTICKFEIVFGYNLPEICTHRSVAKSLFDRRVNGDVKKEEFVDCVFCGRRWHCLCALYLPEQHPDGFTCPSCSSQKRGMRTNIVLQTATNLPMTTLSTFIQTRVSRFLIKKGFRDKSLIIRVVSDSEKETKIYPLMQQLYRSSAESPESFPYRSKTIFAFQRIDDKDVCFFGMYVQEYGPDCHEPNSRRVYIAYLDSVFYFEPKQLRSAVYHEIILGYLAYIKSRGFTFAHIWASPPVGRQDYIFRKHPTDQTFPDRKRLQAWYRTILNHAMIERIAVDYKNIVEDSVERRVVSPVEVPYFAGDFWPEALEKIIEEVREDEAKIRSPGGRRRRKTNTRKAKRCKSVGSNLLPRYDWRTLIDGSDTLSCKMYETMEKCKDTFFVIKLQDSSTASTVDFVIDPDPIMHCETTGTRHGFLHLCRERYLEFSSLRRTKYATLALLHELHTELQERFLHICARCSVQIDGARWRCVQCREYYLCPTCYQTETHSHEMRRYVYTSNLASVLDQKMAQRLSVVIAHARRCTLSNCGYEQCAYLKAVLAKIDKCLSTNDTGSYFQRYLRLVRVHARFCTMENCEVPICRAVKRYIEECRTRHENEQCQFTASRMLNTSTSRSQ